MSVKKAREIAPADKYNRNLIAAKYFRMMADAAEWYAHEQYHNAMGSLGSPAKEQEAFEHFEKCVQGAVAFFKNNDEVDQKINIFKMKGNK